MIRSSSDKGVIALLDARLRTKRYGADFLKSLPDAPITIEIDEVKRFFEEEATDAAGI
jgi:ATP-dependent DNA helicase DinG